MRTAPRPSPVSSDLHETLAAAQEFARLAKFAGSTGCEQEEIAAPDGRSIDLTRVFEAMRRRGYSVSEPVKPQQQPELKRGLVMWTVDIAISGTKATMLFYSAVPK